LEELRAAFRHFSPTEPSTALTSGLPWEQAIDTSGNFSKEKRRVED
jgi:hypothetical protein